jgi:CHAT domain-containing protein/tetratricopeptide (TPR) repeat protein
LRAAAIALACLFAAPVAAQEARVLLLRGDVEAAWDAAARALADSDRPVRGAADLLDAGILLGREEEAHARVRAKEERNPGRGLPEFADGVVGRIRRAPDRGKEALSAALDRLRAAADPETTVVREELAFALQDAGAFREARVLHEGNRASGDPLTAIAAGYGIAYCSILDRDHAAAARLARRAAEEARARNLPLWVGDAEGVLAHLRWIELDADGALAHFEAALAAYESARRPSRQASCLRRMAATHLTRGEYPAGIKRLHRARELALAAGDVREASFCLEHLGSASRDLGDDDLALAQWHAALEEGGREWPPDWRMGTLENIGAAEAARGNWDAALGAFGRALDEAARTQSRHGEPSLLRRIAECLRDSGEPARARERFEESVAAARELGLPPEEVASLVELGRLHTSAGRLGEAERALAGAAELIAGSDSPALEIAALSARAALARARGDLAGALSWLDEAIDAADRIRWRSRGATSIRESAFGRHEELWSSAIEILEERYRATGDEAFARRAFEVSQRARARSLLDLLAETELSLRADPAYRDREAALLAELARLDALGGRDQEIRHVEERLAILESELREADPRWAEIRAPRPVDTSELPSLLDEGELLLEYRVGPNASWVWVATTSSFRMARLPGRERIEEDVRALLPLLADYNLLGSDPTYFVPPATRLSAALLAPIASELARASRVTIVADGILHYLPFEALLTDEVGTTARFAELPWLVHRVDISYLPAVSLRRHLRARSTLRGPAELVVIGDPEPSEDLGPLAAPAFAGAVPARASFAREVEGLVAMHDGPVTRAERGAATVSAVRALGPARAPRLVHFTTHGILNERRPRFSGLFLTPDRARGDDGFLSIDEVFTLELPCEQVVLSACSTALGQQVTGEGLVGLTRAFLYAGARSVVASLWEVPSEPTTQLMLEFYRGIGEGADRTRALADAKRAAIRSAQRGAGLPGAVDPAHPGLWAGFVLLGEGE